MTLGERRGDLTILSSGEKVDLEVSKLEKGCLQRVLITFEKPCNQQSIKQLSFC